MARFVQWLDAVISATAWEIETPKSYGAFHILFTLIGFGLCFLCAWWLRKADEKTNRRLLLGIGIFLVVCEVYKQLFYSLYMAENTYVWWIFPFQLCSVPMYLCILAPLLKPGKLQTGMYNFMMMYNLVGGAIAFAEPSGLMHPYVTLTAHALIWHMLIVFIGLYLNFSGRGGHSKKDYWSATVTFLGLCLMAFAINLLLRDVSGGSVNMFYVGPSNSPLAIFKTISEKFGWYVSTVLYIPVVCLGAYLFFLPTYLYHKRKQVAMAK